MILTGGGGSSSNRDTYCVPVKDFPDESVRRAARWGAYIAINWATEVPLRLHSSEIAEDGSPKWHPDFERWITTENKRHRSRRQDEQLRTTKVMRRMRRSHPRAYEVCYRILIRHESLESTTEWLNERATRNEVELPPGRDRHYRDKDTLALLMAGIDWALAYW